MQATLPPPPFALSDGQSVPWIRLVERLCLRMVLSTSFVAGRQVLAGGVLLDFNCSLRALVGSILAGRLEFFRHRVDFGVGLVVGSHFKNLGSHIRANPATNAQIRVNSRSHYLNSPLNYA